MVNRQSPFPNLEQYMMAVFKAYITSESAERQVSLDSFYAYSKLLRN